MKIKLVELKASEFANGLPKNEIHYLQGMHDKKLCYFAWYNGKQIGIIYDLDPFVKLINKKIKKWEKNKK